MTGYQVRWRDQFGNVRDSGPVLERRAEAEDARVELEDNPEVESSWVDEVP